MYQNAEANRIRTGAGGFLNVVGQPNRMYRSYLESYSQSQTRSEANSSGTVSYSYTYSATWPTDGYTTDPQLPGSCSTLPDEDGPNGNFSFDGSCNNATHECSSTITDGVWSDPTCDTVWDNQDCTIHYSYWTVVTNHEVNLDDYKYHHSKSTTASGSVSEMTWYYQLSDEYTVQELIENIYGDILGTSYDPQLYSGGNATINFADSSKLCGRASKMLMHISLWTEKDVDYVIHWTKVEQDLTDGTTLRTEMTIPVTGTGELFETVIEVLPPKKEGNIYAEDFWAEAKYPEDGGSGSGGSPGEGSTDGDSGSSQASNLATSSSSTSNCGSCGSSSSSTGFRNNASATFQLEMGRGAFGGNVGALKMSATTAITNMITPDLLTFDTADPNTEVVKSDYRIRQVKAPQALADVVTINGNKFEVRYYLPSQVGSPDGNGVYALTGSPYVTWTMENPDTTNAFNRWRIIESRGGSYRTNLYEYTSGTKTWKLTSPGGLREDETKVEHDTVEDMRTETHWVRKPGGADLLKQVLVYKQFSWGEGLIEKRVGPDADPHVTTFIYPTSGGDGHLPLSVEYPDGSWETNEYSSGILYKKTVGFLNGALSQGENYHIVTEYDFAPNTGEGDDGSIQPNTPRRVIRKLRGVEMSRSYKIFKTGEEWNIVCPTPGAAWNASDNLTTITKKYTSGDNLHRISSIKRPDGTMSFFTYSETSTNRTTTETSGQPNVSETATLNGIQTVTVINIHGHMASRTVKSIAGGSVGATLASEVYSEHDEFGRPEKVTYLDTTFGRTDYDTCCGLASTTDRDGVVTEYFYDDLRRIIATKRLGITTSNILDAAGQTLAVIRKGTNNSLITLSQAAFDLAGHQTKETNAVGGVTTFTEGIDGDGLPTHTSIYADGGTRIETSYKDGQLKSITGSAVHPVRYDYNREYDGVWREYTVGYKLDAAGTETGEWIRTLKDGAGRIYKAINSSATGTPTTEFIYNNKNQLVRQSDPDAVSMVYEYNGKGEREYVVQDLNRNGTKDLTTGGAADDRITQTVRDVSTRDGYDVHRIRTYVWTTEDNGSTTALVSTVESAVNGLRTWSTVHSGTDNITRRTEVQVPVSGNSWTRTVTEYEPDNSKSINLYQFGRLISTTRKDSTDAQIGQTTYAHDSHGRRFVIIDARNGTTTYSFNNADRVTSVTTPVPGNGQSAQTTMTHYNTLLQATNVTYADGTSVTNFYTTKGELQRVIGSRTYPVGYTYDSQGRMTHMTNWSAYPSTGARITQWNYNQYRGWLDNKRYPDASTGSPSSIGTDYTYTSAGRLATRAWARGTNTTYGYNNMGDLASVTYNDGNTPSISYTYDRRGRQSTVTRNSIVTTLGYNNADQLTSESYSGGALNGFSVSLNRDSLLRRNTTSLGGVSGSITTSYGYDNVSRLQSVSDGTHSATYTYVANSPLVDNIVFKQSITTRMTTRKHYDKLNRLQQTSSSTNSSTIAGGLYAYLYDNANQRTRATLIEGSYWIYDYDKLGQVTSGKRYWSDGTLVAGQQFEYTFDDIGNRNSTKAGGDVNGANLRSATYSANRLNQYSSRTVPGAVDVLGAAKATSSVTVNSVPATARKSEYYHKEVSVSNSTAAVWQSISVTATEGANSTTNAGNLFVHKTAEDFGYDLDGNMTNDGRWIFTWDGENRLIRMIANTAAGPQQRLDFEYDWKGRRISKKVWNNTVGTGSPAVDQRFVYDQWNLLTITDSSGAATHSFMWGTDLSGSSQGAGGVGGLVSMKIHSGGNAGSYFYSYDANGNTVSLVSAANGSLVAAYEYNAFGEAIRVTGSIGQTNPFRFSSKYTDGETDLAYYGYRYYAPQIGKWTSRDTINETGLKVLDRKRRAFNPDDEQNLYGFVRNDCINEIDPLGQSVLAPVAGWIGTDCAVPDPSDAAWPKWVAYGIAICAAAAIDACLPEKCVLVNVLRQEEMGDPTDLGGNYWPAMKICIYRCTKTQRLVRRYQTPESQCAPSITAPK
jgi:RHS repeat-associated protein